MKHFIRTFMDTFLYFDPVTQSIRHKYLELIADHSLCVMVDEKGGVSLSCSADNEIIKFIEEGRYVISGDIASPFSIKCRGWLCADPQGRILDDRHVIQLWETFNAIRIDAPEILASSHKMVNLRTVEWTPGTSIPHSIHQIRFDHPHKRHLSTQLHEHINRIKELNVDCTYRVWGIKECLDNIREWYGTDMLLTFLRINPRYGAARADSFRYLLVYKLGGIYLDLKSGSTKPFSRSSPTTTSMSFRTGIRIYSKTAVCMES